MGQKAAGRIAPACGAVFLLVVGVSQCPNIHGRLLALVEDCMTGRSPLATLAFGLAWPCEQPVPHTCGALALRSLRSQAVRFSGRIERRWITEKIFGEDVPHSGQFAGSLD